MEFISETTDEVNIWEACSDGDIAKAREFIEDGMDVNSQDESGYSPLHAAVSYGHTDLISYLLSIGADINLRDSDGDQPIHFCEDAVTFEFLLANGADPNAVNTEGENLFHKCIEDERENLMNYLISKGLGTAPENLPQFGFSDTYQEEEEEEEGLDG